jgi:hypothetical protein
MFMVSSRIFTEPAWFDVVVICAGAQGSYDIPAVVDDAAHNKNKHVAEN